MQDLQCFHVYSAAHRYKPFTALYSQLEQNACLEVRSQYMIKCIVWLLDTTPYSLNLFISIYLR